MKVKLNNNLKDQRSKELPTKMGTGMCISGRLVKMVSILKEEDPKLKSFKQITSKTTIREYYEKEQYPDVKKIRVKSFRKMIALFICLKDILKEQYPNEAGNQIIAHIQDLNPNDIPLEILDALEISKRSIYDYLNALQMIIDYSDY